MNTQSTVQHLLDPDWHTIVAEHLDSYPTAIALVVEPAVCGQYDAELGNPCDPVSRGYTKLADIETYIIAYKDTTALWAQMVDDVMFERERHEMEQEMIEDVLFDMRGAF